MLFLHPDYFQNKRPTEPIAPDLFFHTDDESLGSALPFRQNNIIDYPDLNATITITTVEKLSPINLAIMPGINIQHRVVLLKMNVQSNLLGEYSRPLVYALVENAAFCSQIALPNNSAFSHIIHVRYGGGDSSGSWLLKVLQELSCEVFITDGYHRVQLGDRNIMERYPNIRNAQNNYRLEKIRTIGEKLWSNHGNISWDIVKPK